MRCSRCKRELEKSEFSSSRVKLKYPVCKTCEAKKEEKYRNRRILEEESIKDFDTNYGGYSIFILNEIGECEYKYTIQNTNGYFFQTNDISLFKEKLQEIVS